VEHWNGARDAGILRGAYHYLFDGADARRQAQLFISTVGSDKGELPPVVDLEDKYNENASSSAIVNSCKTMLDLIEQAFGRKPMIYSRKTYFDAHGMVNGNPRWALDYELWLAQYPYNFDPTIHPNVNMPVQPARWKPWKFWLYSESAILEGVTGEDNRPTRIDLDWFRGTEEELYEFANVETPVAESYTVKESDTFRSIADEHQITISELLDANPSLLTAGKMLSIPGRVSLSSPDPDPNLPPPLKPTFEYCVKNGDVLSRLAEKYHTTQEAIMVLNPQIMEPKRWLILNDILIIPDGWS
jgi:LysM repeat protein